MEFVARVQSRGEVRYEADRSLDRRDGMCPLRHCCIDRQRFEEDQGIPPRHPGGAGYLDDGIWHVRRGDQRRRAVDLLQVDIPRSRRRRNPVAHPHAPKQNTGNIVLWLCQTAANPSPVPGATPTDPPQCFNPLDPASARSNTVTGVLRPDDIAPSANPNGIARGTTPQEAEAEFREAIALIRAGKTYVNVHSSKFGPGEIRSQIEHRHGGDRD